MRVKILTGNKRLSVYDWPEEKAKQAEKEGKVKILDDVQNSSLGSEDVRTPEEPVDTCKGTKSSGKPCEASPKKDSEYCRWHEPEEKGDE